MKNKSASVIILLLLVIIGILLYNTLRQPASNIRNDKTSIPETKETTNITVQEDIDKLTREAVVVSYVKENGRLPDYYITKSHAREQGWIASKGNLCEVLPGKAIGGDVFTNREKQLPIRKGRTYYEADLNYNCGNRNAHRLIFSNDGLIYVTHDHYKTFEEK